MLELVKQRIYADSVRGNSINFFTEIYFQWLTTTKLVELVIIVSISVFFAAALTVPAGFGLSTMVTPLILLILPPHEAIAVVAIIHGIHNAVKYAVLKEFLDIEAVKKYGIWLVFGALIGASLQGFVPEDPLLIVIGIFLITLPLLSLSEKWTGYRIPEANDRLGGFGSGFMGGLSGHQGALRAMFLKRRLTDKMSYAATASVLALCVDLSRIPVYLFFNGGDIVQHIQITALLSFCAILGVKSGKRFLEKAKTKSIQVGISLGIVFSGVYYIYTALHDKL